MSVFRCNICDEQTDSDFYGCHEDPIDNRELICTNCFNELETINGSLKAMEGEYEQKR